MQDIASTIRSLREQLGLTQAQLAERSGLFPQAVSRLECAGCSPRLSTLQQIANALDLELQVTFVPKPGRRTPRPTSPARGQ